MNKTSRIDWLNHGLEFVVVVIGILLAFQLNEWSEYQKQQDQVKQHLTNILDEAKFNKQQLTIATQQLTENIAAADRVLGQLGTEKDVEVINQELSKLLNVQVFYLNTNAYSTLRESGDIRLIEDFGLKNNIINLYEYYRWIKSLEEGDYNFRFSFLYPYAIENLDIVTGMPQSIEHYDTKSLRNIVGSLKYIMTSRIERYQLGLDQTQAFITDFNHMGEP